jgi:hypothetical protein
MAIIYYCLIIVINFAYLERRKNYLVKEIENKGTNIRAVTYVMYSLLNLFVSLIPFINIAILYFVVFERELLDKILKGMINFDLEYNSKKEEVKKEEVNQEEEKEIDELLEKLKTDKKTKTKRKSKTPASIKIYEEITGDDIQIKK